MKARLQLVSKALTCVALFSIVPGCGREDEVSKQSDGAKSSGNDAGQSLKPEAASNILSTEGFLAERAYELLLFCPEVRASLRLTKGDAEALGKPSRPARAGELESQLTLARLSGNAQRRVLGITLYYFPVESLFSESVRDYLDLDKAQRERIDAVVAAIPRRDQVLMDRCLNERQSIEWLVKERRALYDSAASECTEVLRVDQRESFDGVKVSSVPIADVDSFLSPLLTQEGLKQFQR